MTEVSVKSKVLKAVGELPPDVSSEDVMQRLYLLYNLERGIREHERGDGIPHDEAKRRMKRWHE